MRQVERSAAHKLARGMYEHQSLGLINSCPETVAIHLPTGDDELLEGLDLGCYARSWRLYSDSQALCHVSNL